MTAPLMLRHLVYTGPGVSAATLRFGPGLNLLLGASNTGKSFAVKTIDFMLGAGGRLPDIEERRAYDPEGVSKNSSDAARHDPRREGEGRKGD